jgi:hypothetical protein
MSSELFDSCTDELFQIINLAHISTDANGLVSQRHDLFFQSIRCFRMADVVDDNVRDLAGKFQHDGLADAAVAAGHNTHLTFETHDIFSFPSHSRHSSLLLQPSSR